MTGASAGTLVVLGTGISAINQLTTEARDWIQWADLVCYCVSESLTASWIQRQSRAWVDLAELYDQAAPRGQSYALMAQLVIRALRPGRTVVMALYGHPGIAADPGHLAIAQARAAGHRAWMIAGVSAADVLFADLGIDPCRGGCHWFEATQFLIERRRPDVQAHLILWQIGILNQFGFTEGHRYRGDLHLLQRALLDHYPADHTVIHYQAAQQVVQAPLIQPLPLGELTSFQATGASTLVVPPLCSRHGKDDSRVEQAEVVNLGNGPSPNKQASAQSASALQRLIERLASSPSDLLAYKHDRGGFLANCELDPVERWALLRRHAPLIRQALELGSATKAAVSLGIASSESDAVACCSRWLERSDARRINSQSPADSAA